MNARFSFLLIAASAAALSACTPETPQPRLTALTPAPGADLAFTDDGANAKLAYGGADNAMFALECEHGAKVIHISYRVANASTVHLLTLRSGDAVSRLGAARQVVEDRALVYADTPADTPALAAFRRSGDLGVSYGAEALPLRADQTGRAATARFFAACERTA